MCSTWSKCYRHICGQARDITLNETNNIISNRFRCDVICDGCHLDCWMPSWLLLATKCRSVNVSDLSHILYPWLRLHCQNVGNKTIFITPEDSFNDYSLSKQLHCQIIYWVAVFIILIESIALLNIDST